MGGGPGQFSGQREFCLSRRAERRGDTRPGVGTEGRGARGALIGNGDRGALGGHGEPCLGGEERGDTRSPPGPWSPGQLWGHSTGTGAAGRVRGAVEKAVTPLRRGQRGNMSTGTRSGAAGATLRCRCGGGTDGRRGRAVSRSRAVPVSPFPSRSDMALRRVLALGAALGRRSCCSKVGPGLPRALRSRRGRSASCPWPVGAIRASPAHP